MSLTIQQHLMTSSISRHVASGDEADGWGVSWMPGRRLDRNQAITAMTIAEEVARALQTGSTVADVGLIASLARELDMLCVDAVQMVMAKEEL